MKLKKIINKYILKRKPERFISLNSNNFATNFVITGDNVTKDERLEKEPIEILHELECNIRKLSTSELNKKIELIKERIDLLEDMNYNTDSTKRVLDMLRAYKKYPSYAKLFCWKTTTDLKIQELLKRYKLKHDTIERYVDALPERAITEILQFKEALKKVSRKNPEFSLIAPESYFKKKSKDPILLAQSPFGNYYYILCAWDNEISIVDELLENEEIVFQEKQ